MERRFIAIGALVAVGSASAWLMLGRDRVPRAETPDVNRTAPTGVLLVVHDGTDAWPPPITALTLEGRGSSSVDLPGIENAVDWDWSPELAKLLWLERDARGEPGYRLVIGRSDGSSRIVVARLERVTDYRGRSWAPGGSRVAYSAFTDGRTRLWVVDAATGDRRLMRSWSTDVQIDVDWSPDGTQLAVAVTGGEGAGVFTMDADGADERTVSSLDAYRVDWSPTAPTLVLEATGPDDRVPGVWVVGIDGADQHRLSPPGVLEAGPVWSPDGAWLAFGSERGRQASEGETLDDIATGIYLMRPDGSEPRLLVPDAGPGWHETWDWFASWPPRAT
jgi:WD40 repeat protein